MKTPTHHLNDDLIRAQAAGTLPEAFALVVASHISMCDECRAALQAHEAVGGTVLDTVEPVETDGDALEHVLARIERAAAEPRQHRSGVLPPPLQDYVGGDVEAIRWRSVGGGVKQAILPTEKGATVRLLKIPGGEKMPRHGHRGLELTLVLQGAFSDESLRFGRGDVEVATAAEEHTPIAETGPDCICLAATDAPLRFKGILPRIAQPFLGI